MQNPEVVSALRRQFNTYSPTKTSTHSGLNEEQLQGLLREKQHECAVMKAKSEEIGPLRDTVTKQNRQLGELQSLCEDLKERLRITEMQYATAKDENSQWAKNNESLAAKHSQMQLFAEHESSSKQGLHKEIAELKKLLQEKDQEHKDLLNRSMAEMRSFDEQSHQKDLSMAQLESKFQFMVTQADEYKTKSRELKSELDEIRQELHQTRVQLETTTNRATEAEKQLALDIKIRDEARRLHINYEHAKVDNSRLIQMLSGCSEYKKFLDYYHENNGVTHIPIDGVMGLQPDNLTGSQWKDLSKLQQHYGVTTSKDIDPKTEHESWIPSSLHKMAIDFQQSRVPHVSLDLISAHLRQWNMVFCKREEQRLQKQKDEYVKKIKELKRKNQQRLPYGTVIGLDRMEGIKRDYQQLRQIVTHVRGKPKSKILSLSKPRSVCSRHPSSKKNMSSSQLKSQENLIEASLTSLENLAAQVDAYAAQNEQLRSQLAAAKDKTESDVSRVSRRSFISGASWVADNSSNVLSEMCITAAKLTKDYMELSSTMRNPDPTQVQCERKFLRDLDISLTKARDSLTQWNDELQRTHENPHPGSVQAALQLLPVKPKAMPVDKITTTQNLGLLTSGYAHQSHINKSSSTAPPSSHHHHVMSNMSNMTQSYQPPPMLYPSSSTATTNNFTNTRGTTAAATTTTGTTAVQHLQQSNINSTNPPPSIYNHQRNDSSMLHSCAMPEASSSSMHVEDLYQTLMSDLRQ
eukprot:TRINITY_DN1405_c0_g1_i1.p1 TRINITY_DN1405_c0_g1~~TRINITY_DN1405_c0_g1_i1.p1  ORF type:complete len:748 (-),score=235.78 TRINITY_DN1405_c0_g1_i1:1779-4022(-)